MTQNLPQNAQAKPVERLKSIMAMPSVAEQFQNAMAEHSNLFVASLIDLFVSDKHLQKCNPQLVVSEALKAATLRLPISKALGFAYIVPYKDVPTFIIGYKGLIQLAMRTGQYRYINADVVYEGELKGFSKLTGQLDITGTKTSDTVVGYFAHIETVNGFQKSLYMTREDMEKYGKKYSKSYSSSFSPWQKEFDGMAIKTMLRKLLGKYGVMSIEMAEGMAKDGESGESTYLDYDNEANRTMLDIDNDTGEIMNSNQSANDEMTPEEIAAIQAEEMKMASGPDFDIE